MSGQDAGPFRADPGFPSQDFIATTTAGLRSSDRRLQPRGRQRLAGAAKPNVAGGARPVGPFDTFRETIAALDARGRVVRIARADQDDYEATALMYRLVDRYGAEGAPAVVFEEVKINGEWLKGPVIGNYIGHWDAEALVFGLEPDPANGPATLRKARDYLVELAQQERRPLPGDPAGRDRARQGAVQAGRPARRRDRHDALPVHAR